MDEMIEELKKDIVIYEQAAEDLETGKIRKAGWMPTGALKTIQHGKQNNTGRLPRIFECSCSTKINAGKDRLSLYKRVMEGLAQQYFGHPIGRLCCNFLNRRGPRAS
jgi:hypothetical protein